jgi:hypothetical protein
VPKEPGAERGLLFAELDGVRNVVPIIDDGETDDAWVPQFSTTLLTASPHVDLHGNRGS